MIMRIGFLQLSVLCSAIIGLSACGMTKPYSGYKMQAYNSTKNLNDIKPAAGDIVALNNHDAPKKSCSFSSFHRKNAIGYELDDRRQIGLSVSPSFDMFDPSDAKVEVGLRFSMALGGEAKKRPKCTYGKGYYGFVPYLMNDSVELGGLMNQDNIKSFVQEKIEIREQRRKERQAKLSI